MVLLLALLLAMSLRVLAPLCWRGGFHISFIFRAAAAAALALYTAGQRDPKVLAAAFVAGLVGPILKALDKSAPEFGRTEK
jgi:uncharacterized membrane protein